ncbi:MAG: hypothetical protein M1816_007508 [Peltula sp. TS41687]|nr:MAG: hypothetical protein M1816_007508 [Peltula sp. TS41687]
MATMTNGMNIPTVKVEHDDGSLGTQPGIKTEPDSVGASPSSFNDEDIYEDTGELDFSNSQQMYLMKLPKWLWENWSQIDEDERIQLGTVRVEKLGLDKNGERKQKFTLLLSASCKYNNDVPKEYNMNMSNPYSKNMFIFSEKDLPGFKDKAKARPKQVNGTGSGELKVPSNETGKKTTSRINKRWQPYYRKAIPKQTSLAGIVKHEINCLPVENDEYKRIRHERALKSFQPKAQTKFLTDANSNPGSLLAPGTLGGAGNFKDFIRTAPTQAAKKQETKAARMPQNELLDHIYECFKLYNYWSMKALRAKLNQPEAYLRSTLEMVADIVRSGRFANTWTLKPENKIEQYAKAEGAEEQAPDAGTGFDSTADPFDMDDDVGGGITGEEDLFDDDEDGAKMEDVVF